MTACGHWGEIQPPNVTRLPRPRARFTSERPFSLKVKSSGNRTPFGQLSPAQIPHKRWRSSWKAIRLRACRSNFRKRSFFAISNFSPYLSVKEEDPSQIAEKLKNGQPLRGVGCSDGSVCWTSSFKYGQSGCEPR